MNDDKGLANKLEELLRLDREKAERGKLSAREKDELKSEMLDRIYHGGAWFTTRKDNFIKIEYSAADGCMFARECVVEEAAGGGAEKVLRGGAYTFGTDWFDISFHGSNIDIYCDPETFRNWDIVHVPGTGARFADGEGGERAGKGRLLAFCDEADREALSGAPAVQQAYRIDSAAFARVITLSGAAE